MQISGERAFQIGGLANAKTDPEPGIFWEVDVVERNK